MPKRAFHKYHVFDPQDPTTQSVSRRAKCNLTLLVVFLCLWNIRLFNGVLFSRRCTQYLLIFMARGSITFGLITARNTSRGSTKSSRRLRPSTYSLIIISVSEGFMNHANADFPKEHLCSLSCCTAVLITRL